MTRRLLLAGGGATAHAWTCPGTASEPYEPRTFLGYACADDCRRHKAGFAWAERHRVTDAAACDGLELLQAEGCRAFVEEGARPEAAGDRWATENEIADRCLCDGAGARFRAGCLRAVAAPTSTY